MVKSKQKGDRIANAFSRFPMFIIKTIQVLSINNGDMTLEHFTKMMKVTPTWFKDTCNNHKIFNTFPLDKIEIFNFYTIQNHNKSIEYIKLDSPEKWQSHYREALDKVLKE